ncbi:hypothetical protein M501DRAFT_1013738 [Patellaria atrata CBS 101060]|uniref:RRM domain-containing protein n=1 Tax=Patellaria atrata CBS 101060 TaxID=1346257 RepID=A0A9P4SHC9_9PEZI|nr:hypothetical protein M501DRAFT_1013738 [Patellaria atrata CBS 101060]
MESEIPHRGVAPPNDGMSAARVVFPHSPEDFENDARVSFSKLENKWLLEDDDGSEWEYNEALKKWIPLLDEELLEKQRQAYAVAGVDEHEPAQPAKKRKQENSEDNKSQKKTRKDEEAKTERKNTAVYVTSLPLNVTVDEVKSVFSRCGVIAETIETGEPRIKLYTDEKGNFKGDALIVFFRPESVDLAIQMLDDSDFRIGQSGPEGSMRVKVAEKSYKKQQDGPTTGPKSNMRDKKKIIRKTQQMNNKLLDWSDDEPSMEPTTSKFDKLVYLKHMFTLKELKEDPTAMDEIEEDIRDECSKLGQVSRVTLFDKEESGVVSVKFADHTAAKACVQLMNGRHFAGQQVVAFIASGGEKFQKSRKSKVGDEEEDEEARRLDEFGKWIEKAGEDDADN